MTLLSPIDVNLLGMYEGFGQASIGAPYWSGAWSAYLPAPR